MKHRNDGGYSLALVLVVMAVLATIVTVLLTVTIDNMKVQEKQIERMQDQYEAQGKLEKVLANLSQNQVVELASTSAHANQAGAVKKAIQNVLAEVNDPKITFPTGDVDISFEFVEEDIDESMYDAPFTFDFKLIAKSENNKVTVTYEMKLEGCISHSSAPSEESFFNYLYLISKPDITHKSVDVSGVVASEGGNE